MRRVAGVLALVAVLAGAVVLGGASSSEDKPLTYRAVFDNAFGLTEGGDLKIAGVRAGQTTGFKVSRSRPRKAIVEFEITEPGVGQLREDARCIVRPQSLIGEYFVDCQPGSSAKRLKDGATIPVEQTASTIPADLVNNILRLPYRERLRLIIAELGTGLAGRPEDLSAVLRRAHPGLRETNRTLRILADQRRVIQRFIADAQVVTEALEDRKADVTRFVDEAGDTAAITATRREALRANFQRLPRFLDELRPYLVRLEDLTDAQIPTLANLRAAAPDLNTFLARLGPFSDASRPAFRGLGRSSEAGTRAFAAAQAEVDELRDLARDVPALAEPLRNLLQTLDDRARAVEIDPRAKATAPPAPDRTAIPGEGGFTGFESFWDYFFWQALALNGRDDIGHVLKIIGIEDPDCTPYYTTDEGEEEAFARCNQFLGPDQPGVTTPDPIADGAPQPAPPEEGSPPLLPGLEDLLPMPSVAARGEAPAAPRPEAPVAPGVEAPVAPPVETPAPPAGDPSMLLDFLLGS